MAEIWPREIANGLDVTYLRNRITPRRIDLTGLAAGETVFGEGFGHPLQVPLTTALWLAGAPMAHPLGPPPPAEVLRNAIEPRKELQNPLGP